MIQVPSPTMELRFKKTQPKLTLDIHAPPSKGQIFLQQKFVVQVFDEAQKEHSLIPEGTDLRKVIPPQLLAHIEVIGPSVHNSTAVKVPKLVSMHIQWMNVPAATESDPDMIDIPMPT